MSRIQLPNNWRGRIWSESGTTNEDAEYFEELPNTGCEYNEGSVSIQRFRQSLKVSLENARRTNVLAWGEEISLAIVILQIYDRKENRHGLDGRHRSRLCRGAYVGQSAGV